MKKLSIIILVIAIGIVGYLIFNEINNMEIVPPIGNPVSYTEGTSVIRLDDSTYHINLNEDMCVTLKRNYDTLYIDAIGATIVSARENGDDTVRIIRAYPPTSEITEKSYKLCYNDYFDDVQINHIKISSR